MKPSTSLLSNSVSCSANFNSSTVWSWDVVRCSYQATVSSGNCVGTFALQGSNDHATGANPHQFKPTNWSNISSSSMVVCSTTGGSFIIPAQETCYNYMRIAFTNGNASAEGVVSVRFYAFSL